jgi:hypothetical protein
MAERKLSFSLNGGGGYSKNSAGPQRIGKVTQKYIGGSASATLLMGADDSVNATVKGHGYAGKYSDPDNISKWKGGGVTGGSVGYKTKNWDASVGFDRSPSGRGGTTSLRYTSKF